MVVLDDDNGVTERMAVPGGRLFRTTVTAQVAP